MKKLKLFMVSAALLLITAGVFAGKSSFFSSYSLYGYDVNGNWISVNATLPNGQLLTNAAGTGHAQVSSPAGDTYGLYYYEISPTLGGSTIQVNDTK
jgi:hypothetical protein